MKVSVISVSCLGPKQLKRKEYLDDDISETSIFDILDDDFQIGDIVWAKLTGLSWWPSFIYGSFLDDWKHVKPIACAGLSTKKQYFVYCFGPKFKYAWVHQTCLYRYKGLEHFINYSERQVERATTKRTEENLRKKFSMKMSKDLHPLWKEAIKEADEVFILPTSLRISAFEKMLRPLLIESNVKIPQKEKKQMVWSDRVPIRRPINQEEQVKPQNIHRTLSTSVLSSSSNKTMHSLFDKPQRTFSFNSARNECDNSSNFQSNSFIIPAIMESNDDILIVKMNKPVLPSTISITTAICHFLDKGIPSLTAYEEMRLMNELINHRLGRLLTLTDAQLYVDQYAIQTALINYKHRMSHVQSEHFYDFLLKYPQIILKHRQWFEGFKQTLMPINGDKIELKKWQLATLLHAHMAVEQSFN